MNDEVLDEVERMPPGSHFIVMTHNHPLDLELTAAILARNDFAYFGLIGSRPSALSSSTACANVASTPNACNGCAARWAWSR